MTDDGLVERLRAKHNDTWPRQIGFDELINEDGPEAADEIERLRKVLKYIAYDYVELSHEKAMEQRNFHMRLARKAYLDSFLKPEYVETIMKVDDSF